MFLRAADLFYRIFIIQVFEMNNTRWKSIPKRYGVEKRRTACTNAIRAEGMQSGIITYIIDKARASCILARAVRSYAININRI